VQAVITAAHAHGKKKALAHADGGAGVRTTLDTGADAFAHHPTDASSDCEGGVKQRFTTGEPLTSITL